MMQSPSVLWRETEHTATVTPHSETIPDLILDRVFAELAARSEGESLDRLLRAPLLDSEDVAYRQEVFADLSTPALRTQLETFSRSMRRIRTHLLELPAVRHPVVGRRLRLDILHFYCRTVLSLHQGLAGIALRSRGLRSWRDYLNAYVARPEFGALVSGCEDVRAELGKIRYAMRIDEHRIVIGEAGEAPDYAAIVERLFEPFTGPWKPAEPDSAPLSAGVHPVEERIVDELAELFPGPFRRMTAHSETFADFVDPVLDRVETELRFYLSYQRMVDRLSARGVEFCLPEVTDAFDGIRVEGACDLSLAAKCADQDQMPVTNDCHLDGEERVIVVTGPNQGGKSTFARMFGQLTYLAALGCPVPARRARLMLTDGIFTHFERRESSSDAAGKLESELIAIDTTLDRSTDRTLIILNESFSSTSTVDAQKIGRQVLRKISERKSVAVFVTFLDELAALDGVVSMVAGIGDDATVRTFKLERKPADGRAFAVALADRFDLSYDAIVRRVTR
ncbi:MutS-related protein [Nocardia nova]|uniref:MutS-related protein n=1 Tax=Nocardia nova TaxID=37330 RepID=UPI0033D72FF3